METRILAIVASVLVFLVSFGSFALLGILLVTPKKNREWDKMHKKLFKDSHFE